MAVSLLPIVDPWTWEASNGDATDAQTAAAYQALVNKGLAWGFSRVVWNDLVDKVWELRRKYDLGWVDTYGDVDATRMGNDNILTAARFNALVVNIAYHFWTWDKLPAHVGYLGRETVLGISTKGNDADYVYGHYLLEIAQRLNTVIGIYTDTGNLVRLTENVPIVLDITRNLRADPSAPLGISLPITLDIVRDLRADPSAPLTVDTTAELQHAIELTVERYRLLAAELFPHLRIVSEAVARAPFPVTVDFIGSIGAVADMVNAPPSILQATTAAAATLTAALAKVGMQSVSAETLMQTTFTGELIISLNTGIAAAPTVRLYPAANAVRIYSLPLPDTATPAELTLSADGAIVEPLGLPSAAVEVTTTTDTDMGFGVAQPLAAAAEQGHTAEASPELGEPLGLPGASTTTRVEYFPNLSRIAFLPIAAAVAAELSITATEGENEPPADAWKWQVGDELTIWRTINSRQREDIVLVDIDPKPAEMTAAESITLTANATAFVSAGWEFPKRLPNSKGKILLVKQVLVPSDHVVDAWGWLREGEFELWRTTRNRMRGDDLLLVDIDPKPAEMAAAESAALTASATSFISAGWEFPQRYPDSEGRILIVGQSLAAVQTDDNLEVE